MKKLIAFMLTAFCVIFGAVNAYAFDKYNEKEAVIPFTIEDDKGNETTVAMKGAGDEPAPLIDEVTAADRGEFKVTIDKPGEYTYYIYQTLKSDDKVTRDDTIYTVSILATNGEADGELEISITAQSDKSDAKPDELSFKNSAVIIDKTDESSDPTESSEPTESNDTPEIEEPSKTDEPNRILDLPKTGEIISLTSIIAAIAAGAVIIIQRARRDREDMEN